MLDLDNFEVRPSMGTHRVDVLCRRCKGPVRDSRLGGVATIGTIVAAAEDHEKRLHRPKLVYVAGEPA